MGRQGGGPAVLPGAELSDQYGELFRDCWWPAVAIVTRLTGDLEIAEDAVQDACALALTKWPAEGVPFSPRGWLVGVARREPRLFAHWHLLGQRPGGRMLGAV